MRADRRAVSFIPPFDVVRRISTTTAPVSFSHIVVRCSSFVARRESQQIIVVASLIGAARSLRVGNADGVGSRESATSFASLLSFALVLAQYGELFRACVALPFDFDRSALRWDCLRSDKGGKVALSSSNATATTSSRSTERDCAGGRDDSCSRRRPCLPCERERSAEFESWVPCRTCQVGPRRRRRRGGFPYDDDGDGETYYGYVNKECRFVEGVGPYCFALAGSREAVPCTSCCTES